MENKVQLCKSGEFIKKNALPQDVMKATLLTNGNILAIKKHFNRDAGRGERPIVLSNEDFEEIRILHPGKSLPNLMLAKTINPLELYMDFNTFRVSKNLLYFK